MPSEIRRTLTTPQKATPWQQARDHWSKLPGRSRAIVVGLLVLLVASLIGGRVAVNNSAWVALYPFPVSDADERQITTRLTVDGYPFNDEHAVIRVPPQLKVRLVTMLWNEYRLPHPPVTTPEKPGLFSTGADVRARQLQETEQSLTEAIRTFHFVRDCRVQIVPSSDDDSMLRPDRPTTASVELDLKPGEHASATQVHSIVDLVSHWYAGLKPENVTVVSSDGEDLTAQQSAEEPAYDLLHIKTAYERLFRDALQASLDKEFGPSGYTVVVACEVDPQSSKASSKEITGTHPIDETVNEEHYRGNKPPSTEIAGPPAEGNSVFDEVKKRIKSEPSFTQIERVQAAGALKRVSASLVVNRAITPQQRTDLEHWLKSALGLDESRGDEVCVREGTLIERPAVALPVPPPPPVAPSPLLPVLGSLGLIATAALFFFAWRPAAHPAFQPRETMAPEHDIAELRATQADLKGRLHTLARTQPEMLVEKLRQMV